MGKASPIKSVKSLIRMVKGTEAGAKVPFFNSKFFGDDMALMRKTLRDIDRIDLGTITELVGPKGHPLVKHFGTGVRNIHGSGFTKGHAHVGGSGMTRKVSLEFSPGIKYRGVTRTTNTGIERYARIGGEKWGSMGLSSEGVAVASSLHEIGHGLTVPLIPTKAFKSPTISSLTRELAAWKWASKQVVESGMTKEMKMVFGWSRSFGLAQYKKGWSKALGAPISLQGHYSKMAKSLSEKVGATIKEL